MAPSLKTALIQCLQSLLTPIIRFCLRNSLGLNDILECAKVVFIKVASDEFKAAGEEINVSRLSAATGVHRKDAARIFKHGDTKIESSYFVARVVGQWLNHKTFSAAPGKPKILSFEGDDSQFYDLVRTIGLDLRPGTVLFDMERVGLVERTPRGLKLKANTFVPKGAPLNELKMLGEDAEDFMMAVLENVYGGEERNNIHVVTVYDNVDEADLKRIRKWFADQAASLHKRSCNFLSRFDLDINSQKSKKKKGGRRVLIGTFTRT